MVVGEGGRDDFLLWNKQGQWGPCLGWDKENHCVGETEWNKKSLGYGLIELYSVTAFAIC